MELVTGCGSGRQAILLAALLVLAVAAGGSAAPSIQDAGQPLDLAAMTLTPADLDAAGLPGYRFYRGEAIFPDRMATFIAGNRGVSDEEARGLVEDMGFVRWYENYLYLPVDASDPGGPIARIASSYVVEYSDPEGAATGWNIIEDETTDPSSEDVPLAGTHGDQAEASRYSGVDPVSGDTFRALDVAVQVGNLHAGVRIVDGADIDPDLAASEVLVARLIERVTSMSQDGGPGLGTQVVRLTGDAVQTSTDGYLLVDGVAVPILGEQEADWQRRETAAASAGSRHHYRLWQMVASGDADPSDDVWYHVEMERFRDETAAADSLAGAPARIEAVAPDARIQFDDTGPVFGEQHLSYSVEQADGSAAFRVIAFRVGSTVAYVDVQGPQLPPRVAVEVLAAAQANCLRAGACVEPLTVPSPLAGFVLSAGLGAAQPAETTPGPGDASGNPGHYESTQFGYTLTYDPNAWQLIPDNRVDDAYEWISLEGDSSTVDIIGSQDHGADVLGPCVETWLVDLGYDDGVFEAEPIQPLTEEGDRAFASYALVDQVSGYTAYMYAECRAVSGGSLVIMHFAWTDGEQVPAAEVTAFERVMAGLEVQGRAGVGANTGQTWRG